MDAQQRQADLVKQLILGLDKGYNRSPAGFIPEHELVLAKAVIGRGGFGKVVLGKYNMQTVAVKQIFMGQASPAELATILREAQILEAVAANCRHACRFLGYTIKGSYFCLVMHRYATSLDTVISNSPDGLPLERLERYAAQSMAALYELHRNKVVMLDFKPSNLLLDEAQDAVVVADFGISRITDSINGQLTGSARGAGTPCYMAPEQLYRSFGDDSIKPPLTAAADIWAWACSVIHMATGSAPELELDIMAALRGYLGKKAPAIPAHLPHYLRDILSKCLVVDPLKRPSALEVLKTWQAALQPAPGVQAAFRPMPGVQAAPRPKPREQAPDTVSAKPSPSTSAVVNMLATVGWRIPLVVLILFVQLVMPNTISYITGNRITADCASVAQSTVVFGMVAAWTRPISTRQGLWGMACRLVFYISYVLTRTELLYAVHLLNVWEATGISKMVSVRDAEGFMFLGVFAASTWPSKTSRQTAISKQGAWGTAYRFVMWLRLILTAGCLLMTVCGLFFLAIDQRDLDQ